jgi:HlyD family secretion protein
MIKGKVLEVHTAAMDATVIADLSLDGPLPDVAKAGAPAGAEIDLGILYSVVQVGRPVTGADNSMATVFRLDEDGETATRVPVRFGKSSATTIEVIDGLNVGDRIILSDMSALDGNDRIRLQ